jgi:hypothetical protein
MVRLSLVLAILACPLYAQPLPAPAEPDYAFVLAAMKAERLKVRSGVCRIKGTFRVTDPSNPWGTIEGPLEILVAFEGDKLRFDRTQPGWVMNRQTKPSQLQRVFGWKPPVVRRGTEKHHFCDNGHKAVYWNEDHDTLSILPSAVDSQRRIGYLGFFEVRGLGLHRHPLWQKQLRLPELFEVLGKRLDHPVVHRDRTDCWSIQSESSDEFSESKESLTVDVSRGFIPIEFSLSQRKRRQGEPWHPVQWMATRWEQRGEVWLPTHHSSRISLSANSKRVEWEASLTWEKLNEPIDPTLFDYKSFNVSEWVWIMDSTLPNEAGVVQIGKPRPPEPEPPAEEAPLLAFGLGTLVFFTLVVGLLLYLRWRRRKVVVGP